MKSYKFASAIIIGAIITLILYYLISHTPQWQIFLAWAQQHFAVLFIIVTLFKALGAIWPPIPGTALSLAMVPVWGWIPSVFADVIGSRIGAVVDYLLGKRFGKKLIHNVFHDQHVEKLQKIKINPKTEFEILFLLQLIGAKGLSEVVYYMSGFMRLSLGKLFWSGLIANLILAVPFYYFANGILGGDFELMIALPLLLIGAFFIFKYRKRYISFLS